MRACVRENVCLDVGVSGYLHDYIGVYVVVFARVRGRVCVHTCACGLAHMHVGVR